jgi:hypothetical protein
LTDYFSLTPWIVGISFLAGTLLVRFGAKYFYKRRLLARFVYDCRLSCGEKDFKLKCYYDSGNKAYHPLNLLPVVMLSKQYFEQIADGGDGEFMEVRTVAGAKRLEVKKVALEVYFGKGARILYSAVAASADSLSADYQLILHSDMLA